MRSRKERKKDRQERRKKKKEEWIKENIPQTIRTQPVSTEPHPVPPTYNAPAVQTGQVTQPSPPPGSPPPPTVNPGAGSTYVYIPAQERRTLTVQTFQDDALDISRPIVTNTNYNDANFSHIASMRPEILASTELYPIYPDDATSGERLTGVGNLISFEQQSMVLKGQILQSLIREMLNQSGNSIEQTTLDVQSELSSRLSVINQKRSVVKSIYNIIQQLKSNYDFKSRFVGQNLLTFPQQASDTFGEYSPPTSMMFTEFLSRLSQYNEGQLKNYSNTKLFLTLCSDLNQVFSLYSLNLFNENDPNRITDQSSIDIDVSLAGPSNRKFNYDTVRSRQGDIFVPVDPVRFNSIQSELPSDHFERLMLLLLLITREIRVSTLIGTSSEIREFGSGDYLNPYDNIFGTPGTTIFQPIKGPKSLSSIAVNFDGNLNKTIFPFENVFIQNETAQSSNDYIPGTRYFMDSILESNDNQFNIAPLTSYVQRTSDILTNLSKIVQEDFALKTNGNSDFYSADLLYRSLLNHVKISTSGIGTIDGRTSSKDQAFAIGLYRLCSDDPVLRLMVYQYFILAGCAINSAVIDDATKVPFIDLIATELMDVRSLSYFNSYVQNENPDNVRWLDQALSLKNRTPATFDSAVQFFAGKISSYITNKLSTNNSASQSAKADGEMEITLNWFDAGVKDYLYSIVSTRGSITKGTLLYDFFDLLPRIPSSTDVFVQDGSLRTRFNGLSPSLIGLFLFEALCSTAKIFGFVDFTIAGQTYTDMTAGDVPIVYQRQAIITRINWAKQRYSREMLDSLLGSNSSGINVSFGSGPMNSVGLTITSRDRSRSFELNTDTSTRELTQQEYSNIASQAPDIVFLYGDTSSTKKPQIQSRVYDVYRKLFFEEKTLPGATKGFVERLRTLLCVDAQQLLNQLNNQVDRTVIPNLTTIQDVPSLRISDQMAVAYENTYGQIQSQSVDQFLPTIFSKIAPSDQEVKALFALFKEPEFLPNGDSESPRARIFSVGIPNGLSQGLRSKISLTSILGNTSTNYFSSGTPSELDWITIKVYKKDLRFEYLVFKPKVYNFDLSLFIQPSSFDVSLFSEVTNPDALTIDEIAQAINFYHYAQNSLDYAVVNTDTYAPDSSEALRQDVLRNHLESYLLQRYIAYTTGLTINEKTFVQSSNAKWENGYMSTKLNKEFMKFLLQRGEPVTQNMSVQDVLASPRVSEQSKILTRLFSFPTQADPNLLNNQFMNHADFERVFHFVETTEAYEVDMEATKRTESGQRLLANNEFQQSLVKIGDSYFLPLVNMNGASVSDYYVTIEAFEFVR